MAYLPMGDLDASNWNSTRYPGVCKPTNFEALGHFKKLQIQLNRIAQAKGMSKVAVDGDIGPGTIKLAAAIYAAAAADAGISSVGLYSTYLRTQLAGATSCTALASRADMIATAAEKYANALKVPAQISQPSSPKPSTIVTSSGEVTAPAQYQGSGSSGFGTMGTAQKVVAGVALGGLVFFLIQDQKKRRRGAR
mgnify:CR=1 FL=1